MFQAMSVAATLNLPELLARGPRLADELAAATGCHAPSLQRLLRALAAVPLWTELADGRFELAALGEPLRENTANGLRHFVIWWGQHLWREWGHLLHTVQTGQSAREKLTNTRGMERLEHDAASAAVFDRAMAEMTRLIAGDLARVSEFSGAREIVDIGGGNGELIASVLRMHPVLRGVLFDRPHAIEAARENLKRAGVIDRCEMRIGDFFAAIPAGADAYLLKSVIHDWNDEHSIAIFMNCRKAMPSHAKLLLIEQIVSDHVTPSAINRDIARRDINMMVCTGGRERRLGEFRALLAKGGFNLTRTIALSFGHHVLVAQPR